jgi:hypothetical protein
MHLLRMQVVLLGDDQGSLHLCSLTSDKLLATKQVAHSRIAAIISCDTTTASSAGSNDGGGGGRASRASSSGNSREGSYVQFAVLCEERVGLWQLRQGFNHGIVPGGHRQGVLVLQYCGSRPQVRQQAQHLLCDVSLSTMVMCRLPVASHVVQCCSSHRQACFLWRYHADSLHVQCR